MTVFSSIKCEWALPFFVIIVVYCTVHTCQTEFGHSNKMTEGNIEVEYSTVFLPFEPILILKTTEEVYFQ